MRVAEADLERWGTRIGSEIETPVFIGLSGQLGAGKSVLARAVARGAGVTGTIPSPTFNLLHRYVANHDVTVAHLDLYRIESPDELWEIGWEELGAEGEIVLVEWAENAGDLLPKDRWEIELTIPEPGDLLREVSVREFGEPAVLPSFPMMVSER